jgi:hypothetical protein
VARGRPSGGLTPPRGIRRSGRLHAQDTAAELG